MKKKTAYILLGVFLTTSILGGCGSKNKATEAASESAQTEKEGAGEAEELTVTPTPEEEKDTEKKADSSEDAEASTQSNEAEEESAPVEEPREKIAVLLPNEEKWSRDADKFKSELEDRKSTRLNSSHIL